MSSDSTLSHFHDKASVPAHAHPNQFALLKQRRFAPFFWTQFSGAANDNLFKFAFTVMVTYQLSISWLPPAMAGLAIGALFILPFLLFSATSGQLTDKFEKSQMIRFVKNLEIVIMLIAACRRASAPPRAFDREPRSTGGAARRAQIGRAHV